MKTKHISVIILSMLLGITASAAAQTFSCDSVTEIPKNECHALEALYTSANGANWTNKTGWLQTNTPCSWFGITCNVGSVTKLELPQNGLTGSLPAQIGNLAYLTHLSLWGNGLEGAIPSEIGQLARLTFISLSENTLTGEIPATFGNLTELVQLGLHHNQLTGMIPDLTNLSKLYALNLDTNELSGELRTVIERLPLSIQRLDLRANRLSGSIPKEIQKLAKLQQLILTLNLLTGDIPAELGNLVNLTQLSLDHNQLTGSLAPFIAKLAAQSDNTLMNAFYLDGNRFTGELPAEFGKFTNLQSLGLYDNGLTGSLPMTLMNLTKLQELDYKNTKLCEPQDTAFQTWLKSIPKLAGTHACDSDVWIQDTLPDEGIEPNANPLGMWMSQAIWIRNSNDSVAAHQNPRAGVMNSVYVNVRNRGSLPSQPEGKVKVYWAYASTGLSWPGQWHEIGEVALPAIAPNNAETFTARLAWTPPMPGHYCLIARIESQNDPMTVPETANVDVNTRNNNNVAWRNMNVIGASCEAAELLIQNVPCGGGGYADSVDLVFDGSPDLFANSDVTVIMDLGEMFSKWLLAGGKGEAIRVLQGTTTVQLLSSQATISGIPMVANEKQSLRFRINVPSKFEKTGSYHLNIKQRVCGAIIGGVDYDVTPCLTETESMPPTPTAIPSVSPTPTEPPFVTPVPTEIPAGVPEPATLMLFGIGLLGGGILLRKRMKK